MRLALLVMLAACGHKSSDDCTIVRDDAETSAKVVNRIVTTAKSRGYENLSFAVKNK